MLSVQLSVIKLVFKNPCVVKARFCPLDIFVKTIRASCVWLVDVQSLDCENICACESMWHQRPWLNEEFYSSVWRCWTEPEEDICLILRNCVIKWMKISETSATSSRYELYKLVLIPRGSSIVFVLRNTVIYSIPAVKGIKESWATVRFSSQGYRDTMRE